MQVEYIFLIIGSILFLGYFGEVIFRKTNVPDVIWLIIIGILMSNVFNWVNNETFGGFAPLFTTFALIYILFEGALNIDIRKLFANIPQGLKLSLLSFVFSFLVCFVLGLLFGYGAGLSALMGTILSGVSSAVVLPIIKNIKSEQDTKLVMTLDSAISDVLCITATIALMEIVVYRQFSASQTLNSLIGSFLIALVVGVCAGYIWVYLLKDYFQKSDVYILTLAFLLIVYFTSEYLKANGAIATLAFGLVLGNSKKMLSLLRKEESQSFNVLTKSAKTFYSEISFFIKTFFFVYLGILMDLSNLWSFLWAFFITLGLFLVRPFAVYLSAKKYCPRKDRNIMETLIPKGLAAAVLVQLLIQEGVQGAQSIVNVVLAVILFSIVASSAFIFFIEKNMFKGLFKVLYR